MDARPVTLSRGASLLALSHADARQLLVVLAVLHDLGKFSDTFYRQHADLWPDLHGAHVGARGRPHVVAGYALWRRDLKRLIGPRLATTQSSPLESLLVAAFGHHGRPITKGNSTDHDQHFNKSADREAGCAFAQDAIGLLCEAPVAAPEKWDMVAKRASWWVSGLISVADWIGSRQQSFPYRAPDLSLAEYWDVATCQAREAVHASGLVPPAIARGRSFVELTRLDKPPTPLQRWALDVPLPDGPSLFIVEDVTGAGKTEAAQILLHRLMGANRASGAYWGMPTQATANAMYERQRKSILALFDDATTTKPSLVLAHGQSKLHEEFRATVLGNQVGVGTHADDDDDLEGADSVIACAAFLADDRRASLLADIGAGTIDQALLAVLPSKFNTIRLLGLVDKVLVLDEVHAYDAYMQAEIETLLEFQAALGGSTVLLSATLTQEQRDRFVRAWRGGRSGDADDRADDKSGREGADVPYPLATIVDGAGARTESPIEPAPWSTRTVPVVLVHDSESVVESIVQAHRRGDAVVWIRNTVDGVLEAAQQLRERDIKPLVFHGRFAQCDRQAREAEVMAAFGPGPHGNKERHRVLVASQVVEQSLDLDFDMLVTDLAPIDLIIQRCGRLWRHQRPRPAGSREELVLLAPRFTKEPVKDWLDAVLPKVKYVYEDVGVLWRTSRELTHHSYIETPLGVRGMIERVYADDYTPPSLDAAVQRVAGRDAAQGAMGRNFALSVDGAYIANASPNWYSDIRVPTRLIDQQTVIRLAHVTADGSVVPWSGGAPDNWKAWALSEVRVSSHKVPKGSIVLERFKSAVATVKEEWPKYERDVLLLPLEREGDGWIASFALPSGSAARVAYSELEGLRM
jgi:CRISPR-associated endonuclease/helicase Cas3